MVQVITFDFWCTLFVPGDPHLMRKARLEGVQGLLGRFGLEREPEDILNAFKECWLRANYEQRALGRDMGPRGQVSILAEILNLPGNETLREELYQVFTGILVKVPPTLMPHARETLEHLASAYKLGLICNTGATPGVRLRVIMRQAGILDFFSDTVFSDEVEWAKPNTAIFKHSLNNLGGRGLRAAHIGDDPLTDVIGAKKAGLKAVWLAPSTSWAVPECDWHVKALDEMVKIFGSGGIPWESGM